MTVPEFTPEMWAAVREAALTATTAEWLLATDALSSQAIANLVVGLRSAVEPLAGQAMVAESEWLDRTAAFLAALHSARLDDAVAEPSQQGRN